MPLDTRHVPAQVADLVARGKLVEALQLLRRAKEATRLETPAIDRSRGQGELKLEPGKPLPLGSRDTASPRGMSFDDPAKTAPSGSRNAASPRGMSLDEPARALTPQEAQRILVAGFTALTNGAWRDAHRLFKSLSAQANAGRAASGTTVQGASRPMATPSAPRATSARADRLPLARSRRRLAPGEVPRASEWPVVAALLLLVVVGWLAFR
jgi:hypothetical protein